MIYDSSVNASAGHVKFKLSSSPPLAERFDGMWLLNVVDSDNKSMPFVLFINAKSANLNTNYSSDNISKGTELLPVYALQTKDHNYDQGAWVEDIVSQVQSDSKKAPDFTVASALKNGNYLYVYIDSHRSKGPCIRQHSEESNVIRLFGTIVDDFMMSFANAYRFCRSFSSSEQGGDSKGAITTKSTENKKE